MTLTLCLQLWPMLMSGLMPKIPKRKTVAVTQNVKVTSLTRWGTLCPYQETYSITTTLIVDNAWLSKKTQSLKGKTVDLIRVLRAYHYALVISYKNSSIGICNPNELFQNQVITQFGLIGIVMSHVAVRHRQQEPELAQGLPAQSLSLIKQPIIATTTSAQ